MTPKKFGRRMFSPRAAFRLRAFLEIALGREAVTRK